jgi:transposase
MPQPHHVGLDISVKETTISVVDEMGHVAHRAVVASDPTILVEHLLRLGFTYSRIGLEAGPLSAWIYTGLVDAGLPAICVDGVHPVSTGHG